MMLFGGNRFCQHGAARLWRIFIIEENPTLDNVEFDIEIRCPTLVLAELDMA